MACRYYALILEAITQMKQITIEKAVHRNLQVLSIWFEQDRLDTGYIEARDFRA